MGRILIVDDTLFMRTLLKNILFSGGHSIVGEAGDGDEVYREVQGIKTRPRYHGCCDAENERD